MLRIYGSAKSRALRTIWLAGELGLQYEHLDYLPRSAPTRTPEFTALNPNRRVPVIDDDGFVLSESMAINLYLARKHRSSLYPADPQQEALMLQWCFWETDRLDRQIVLYMNHSSGLPPEERQAALAQTAWSEMAPAFDVLEQALTASDWLLGSEFSLADLNVAAALYRGLFIDLAQWPRTRAWLVRCWARPAAVAARKLRE
jgi:glutathione S-transferase